jgi:hypothetical protein
VLAPQGRAARIIALLAAYVNDCARFNATDAATSHGAGRQRLLDPGADEAHFVVEANAVLLLEAADARLDLLFLGVELLLELSFVSLELMFDLSFERTLALLE